ncbi:MAG: right-handed parallel beta-helix repeat-containing protein [Candidatus Binataceae bacterium]
MSLGFDVGGSYIALQNWNISTQANQPGIHVMGSASHVWIENSYIHELCQEGVYVEPTTSYVTVQNNKIWRAEMAGAQMDGSNGTFSGNEVWDTQQYPSALGGIYAGCSKRSGADADGVRVFGTNQSVSSNYFHNIADDWGSARNLNPHTDCVQSWGPLAGLTYTGNTCAWSAPTSTADKEFCEFEALNGAKTTGLTFQNNVFINGRDGCQFESPITGVNFSNNTMVGVLNESANFNSVGNTVVNNISYDSGDGGDAAWCAPNAPSGNTVTGNVRFNPSGTYGTYCSAYSETRVNPLFVSVGTGFASYPQGNYHLQVGSPAIGKGAYP